MSDRRSDLGDLFGGGPQPKGAGGSGAAADTTSFAHSSERLFARLLDFYGIRWEYEPRAFDLELDADGQPTERFTPDFYLPDYDLFIEITTMSQRLVTRKNRKVRWLRETHPEIRCKVFYQRDIFRLATRHGLEVPTEDLTANGSSR